MGRRGGGGVGGGGGGGGSERAWSGREVGAFVRGVVGGHAFPSAFLAQGADDGVDFGGGEEGVGAECAGADAFFHAHDLPAIEAVGSGGEE